MATSLIPDKIPLTDLTEGKFNGNGVVDKLMQSVHSFIEHESNEGRITGPEYAKVCLGLIEQTLNAGVTFLLQQQKAALEAKLIEAQIRLADKQVEIAEVELQIKLAELPKVQAEITLLNAQAALVGQQKINAEQELLNLKAQECKLKAEYDHILAQVQKTAEEKNLLAQKVLTEKAQVTSMGVDEDSVIGRQKVLYLAQKEGFLRDAEQKAAKLLADTWNVRRTTDEATQVNTTNKLDDATVGRAVEKMLTGVGA